MNKRILVVDDEPGITRMIKLVLDQTGRYEVLTENLGRRAVEVAREFRPDLILMDVIMPGMLGSEIAARLREDPQLRATRIVFVTAVVTKDEEANTAGAIGGQHFVAKPISANDLCKVVEDHLAR